MRKNQRRRHERHLFSFDPAIRTKNFRKLLYFSLLLIQTAGTLEEACPYIAKLHPCQEILAYELERISFVGELTSFNTNSTINGQLFAKGEKKFSLRRLRFFSISLLNGVLHLGLYSAVQSKRKVACVADAWK